MKLRYYTIAAVAALSVAACDDGNIYDDVSAPADKGTTFSVTGRFDGVDTWPDGYGVVLAAFDGESDYAIVSKAVPVDDGEVTVELSGISGDVASLEVCAVDRLRRRVATFASVDYESGGEPSVVIDAGRIDVGMFAGVQSGVFDVSCTACHGGSSHAAAGLMLMPGRSYESLVGAESRVVAGSLRVTAGNADESVLYRALATDLSRGWAFDHSDGLVGASGISLVKAWIDAGANR